MCVRQMAKLRFGVSIRRRTWNPTLTLTGAAYALRDPSTADVPLVAGGEG